jgi:DNA-binding NarL/FixJ family response regulator
LAYGFHGVPQGLHSHEWYKVRALKAGATGYLLKNMIWKDLPESIRVVHAGRRRIPAEIAEALVEHGADGALTEREPKVCAVRRIALDSSKLISPSG